jgi:hypothetical protein
MMPTGQYTRVRHSTRIPAYEAPNYERDRKRAYRARVKAEAEKAEVSAAAASERYR